MKIQSVFLAALFLVSIPSISVAQAPQPSVPLKIVAGMPVVDKVFINGHGPYRFLVDTGTQSNHVDSSLARKLGLLTTLQVHLRTPSGESIVDSGRANKVTLGPVEAFNQELLFTHFDDLSTLSPDIQGILGQEFLSHFDYVLDFQHHRLTFGESSAAGVHTGFRLIFGRMAVTTSVGDLVLDSGAEVLFLFRGSTRGTVAQVIGASGARVIVSLEAAPEVRIGDHSYHPAKANYRNVPTAEEVGLLPANLFHAIFVCNSKQYVIFDPAL